MRISDWSSDVCSSDLPAVQVAGKDICPMCPGVENEGPAACPKCGMPLELAAPMPLQRQVQYTCPMHPEVVQDEPGECPKCGMALEPITVSAEEKNPELIEMTRRFWVGAGLTVPVLVRSEEHTSELQSLMRISYAVFCLKKKKTNTY